MDRVGLINYIKYNKYFYGVYSFLGNNAIRLIRLFVRKEDHLIVFVSFGGRKYDDSPKCIYEAILRDNRFDGYRLVWAFLEPDKYEIPRGEKIRIDTPQYFIQLLKAACWVTNSGVERGLSFKGKRTFYLNTWHGTAMKKMGSDIDAANTSFGLKSKKKTNTIDVMLAQGQYDIDVFSRAFQIPEENFRLVGLPRNDELSVRNTLPEQQRLKQKLGIPAEKKVLLYAPTFREYTKDSGNNVVLALPVSFEKMRAVLSEECVLLLRAHYEVVKVMNIRENEFLRDVSSYPNLNELMLASDILISDYSSIFFDFSILRKPMLCFAYDYQEYMKQRGLYFDIREYLQSQIEDEDTLIEEIQRAIYTPEEYIRVAEVFRSRFITEYGHASQACADIIIENV